MDLWFLFKMGIKLEVRVVTRSMSTPELYFSISTTCIPY